MKTKNEMKKSNIIKIQISSYKGATLEIDTAKVSKEAQDYFTKELQPERFKIWETRIRQSYSLLTIKTIKPSVENTLFNKYFYTVLLAEREYFVDGFEVATVPLEEIGYRAITESDKLIFVNSKLPKAERTKIIRHFIQQHKQNAS